MPQVSATDVRSRAPAVRPLSDVGGVEAVPARQHLGADGPRRFVLPRSLRIGRNIGIFVAALVATSYAINSLAPPRELPSPLREKLAHFAKHRDEYDVVFIGS